MTLEYRQAVQLDHGLSTGLTPRIGFALDAVGYGRRSAPLQAEVGCRLRRLIGGMVVDAGTEFGETDNDGGSGDGMAVFLPLGTDHSRALPALIESAARRLSDDNARHSDRIRLRMAVGSGLVGFGPMGFTGQLIVELTRLVNSSPLRREMTGKPGCDLAVLASNALYEDVIRPGYLDADRWAFRRVRVAVKEYRAPAWLWPGS